MRRCWSVQSASHQVGSTLTEEPRAGKISGVLGQLISSSGLSCMNPNAIISRLSREREVIAPSACTRSCESVREPGPLRLEGEYLEEGATAAGGEVKTDVEERVWLRCS